MIARSPHPQEHCGHECVCHLYSVQCWHGHHKTDRSEPCSMKGVLIEPCPHDTRTHSSSPAPVPEKTNGGDPWNCTDLGIECPDPEQEWCDWPCDKWLEYHDADVARKVREQVLDALEAEMKRSYADNPNPILPIEQGEHQCTGFWLTRLESLRSGEGVQR